jgi:hypothetical protein
MAQINNSDLIKALIDGARLHAAAEKIPDKIASVVVPVLDVTPSFHRIVNIVKFNGTSSTGSSIIYTTPTNKDFYLAGAFISANFDATADNVLTRMLVFINSTDIQLLQMNKNSLTAFSGYMNREFTTLIKIDRGTPITITSAFTVGAGTYSGGICGIEVEP